MSSSAYSLTAIVPASGFQVIEGSPVLGGLKNPEQAHHFCPDCLTWMFTRVAMMPDTVNVRPTIFARPDWAKPFIETYTSEKMPFAETGATHGYETFPSMDEVGPLLEEFAREWASRS